MKTAFFPARTLASLPADNMEALAALCTEFERFDGHARELPEHHDDYVEALGILKAFSGVRDARLQPLPELGSQRHQNIDNIKTYFKQLRDLVRAELSSRHAKGYFESKTEQYLSLFARMAAYEFSETELKRVMELTNEIRDLALGSHLLADEQKRRLVRKLDAMRNEVHRKTSDIDRFWGFLGEASLAMRKFGEDFKPISDRVLELAQIVIGVIFTKEGVTTLPELCRLLSEKEQRLN